MVFPILNLPTEVIDHIAEHLPQEDIPGLALTCERIYKICIGYYYRTVVIASTRFDTNSLPLQKQAIKRMDRLSSDINKRHGIRELTVHDIGLHSIPVDAPDRVIPEPFLTEFRKERVEWNRLQPIFLRMVESFLFSGHYDFPRLQTLSFDVGGLTTEVDAHRFLEFLKRQPQIQNVIVEGYPRKMFTFLRTPHAVDLSHLRRLSIYGPLLPLLIGYPFSITSTEGRYEPLATRIVDHKLPLMRVHIWWPQQRKIHVCHVGYAAEIDPIHVLKALASVCKGTLRSLQIDMAVPHLDTELIEFITENFPNLRELNICPAGEFYLIGQTAYMWMADRVGKLKHLERFTYSVTNAEDTGYYSALRGYAQNPGSWNAISAHFAGRCSSLKFLKLCSLVWRRVVEKRTTLETRFELLMT